MPLYLQNESYYLKCHCHHIIIFLNSFLHQTSIYKIHKCCFLLLIEYNNNDAILYWQRVAFLHVAALNFLYNKWSVTLEKNVIFTFLLLHCLPQVQNFQTRKDYSLGSIAILVGRHFKVRWFTTFHPHQQSFDVVIVQA